MFAKRTNWNLTPNRLSEALAAHKAAGKPLLDLTASNPTECGFSYDEGAILRALSNPAALKYEPNPKGLLAAREAVAQYYAEKGAAVPVDNIVLTTSTSEAYSFAFRLLCDAGDEVLIPEPSYPLFGFLADIQDVKPVRYPLIYDHGWQIDFHALERAITPRTRAVIVVHPNNPTGHFTKAHEIEKLNELCSQHGLALIVDEVFLDFHLAGRSSAEAKSRAEAKAPESRTTGAERKSTGEGKPATFAANAGALTFTLSGLSKIAGLPQVKAAWMVVSGRPVQAAQALERLELIADTYLSMSTPVQLAVPELLSQRERFQEQVIARLRANLAELDGQLAKQKPCECLQLEGGWYTVLRVPATRSDDQLAIDLLTRHGLYVHPGHFYDFASDGFLVLSLLTPESTLVQGLEALFRAV